MTYIHLPQAPAEGAGVHRTEIEWCDYALGGLVRAVSPRTGKAMNLCAKVSTGCGSCYAESITRRFHDVSFTAKATKEAKWFFDEGAARSMMRFRPKPPYKNGRTRPAVFADDMTDPFGEWVSDEWLDRRFAIMALRPDVDWLLLTKRAGRMAAYLSDTARERRIWETALDLAPGNNISERADYAESVDRHWPLPNVYLGVSVENQATADERIPLLQQCPAAVRFLSVEPQVEPIEWRDEWAKGLHGLIAGGESGRGARPYDVAWARAGIKWVRRHGIKAFVKQVGSTPVVWCSQCGKSVGKVLGGWVDACGPTHAALIAESQRIHDPKGGEMSEWPADLRVRELP